MPSSRLGGLREVGERAAGIGDVPACTGSSRAAEPLLELRLVGERRGGARVEGAARVPGAPRACPRSLRRLRRVRLRARHHRRIAEADSHAPGAEPGAARPPAPAEASAAAAVRAIERVGALQAQWSPAPYVALWTRLEGFRISQLERALAGKRVVKATLMRSTLHLVSSADYPAYAAAIVEARRPKMERIFPVDIDVIAERLREATTEPPRTWDEWRELMIGLAGRPIKPGEIWPLWTVSFMHARLVHLPPSGTYGFYRGAHFVPFDELGRRHTRRAGGADEASRTALSRRVRPRDVDDMASWIGVPYAGDSRGPRRRAADVPRRGRPPALRPPARAAAAQPTRRRRCACSRSGIRRSSPTRRRNGRDPPRSVSQARHRAERRRRSDRPRGRLCGGHVEGREEAPAGRAVRRASAQRSATSSPPRKSGCSRSSRERARADRSGS